MNDADEQAAAMEEELQSRKMRRCRAVEHCVRYKLPEDDWWMQLELKEAASAVSVAPTQGPHTLCALGCQGGVLTVANAYLENPTVLLNLFDGDFFPHVKALQTHDMQQCVCVRWSRDCSRVLSLYDLRLKTDAEAKPKADTEPRSRPERIFHTQLFVYSVCEADLLHSIR
jgi:hypothetical protein